MKILIVLFFILNFSNYAQHITIKGKIVDAETNHPLVNANILGSKIIGFGTNSDQNGEFVLTSDIKNSDTISISFVGYETRHISVEQLSNIPSVQTSDGNLLYTFRLNKKAIPSQTILVESTIGEKGITPLASISLMLQR
jgi:iron complex outermembrane receptor protein